MADLITLAEYKALTGTTSSDDDALLAALISSSSEAIERYLDRELHAQTIRQWTCRGGSMGYVHPTQYPIIAIYGAMGAADAIRVDNSSSTNGYAISIVGTTLSVTGPSMATDTYDLEDEQSSATVGDGSGWLSLDELVDLVEDDYPDLDLTLLDGVAQNATTLSQGAWSVGPGGSATIMGAEYGQHVVRLSDRKEWLETDADLVIYSAGYSTIPGPIKSACANCVRDALKVQKGTQATGVSSFSITNYSETYADWIDWNDIVANHSGELSPYRRVALG